MDCFVQIRCDRILLLVLIHAGFSGFGSSVVKGTVLIGLPPPNRQRRRMGKEGSGGAAQETESRDIIWCSYTAFEPDFRLSLAKGLSG